MSGRGARAPRARRHVRVGDRRVPAHTKGGDPLAFGAKRGTGVSDHFPIVAELTRRA